jgi:hypothetical protein
MKKPPPKNRTSQLRQAVIHIREITGVDILLNLALGGSREGEILFHRALLALYFYNSGVGSYASIGALLGRDHATVINLLKYPTKRAGRDGRYAVASNEIEAFFKVQRYGALKNSYEKTIAWHRSEILRLEQILNQAKP